jgi:hypothetical protein
MTTDRRETGRERAQRFVDSAQASGPRFPTPEPIATAPCEPARKLLLYCPGHDGWQTGEWLEERKCWVSTAGSMDRLDPTHWMDVPDTPHGL